MILDHLRLTPQCASVAISAQNLISHICYIAFTKSALLATGIFSFA